MRLRLRKIFHRRSFYTMLEFSASLSKRPVGEKMKDTSCVENLGAAQSYILK